jgi:hypothetical protein
MVTINLTFVPYRVLNGIVFVSENDVKFHTNYNVISPKTGVTKTFNLECTTGPGDDPNTEWVYKSSEGLKLHLCNSANALSEINK